MKPLLNDGATILYAQDFPSEREVTSGTVGTGQNGWEFQTLAKEAGTTELLFNRSVLLDFRPFKASIWQVIAKSKKARTLAHINFNGTYLLPQVYDAFQELYQLIDVSKPVVVLAGGPLVFLALGGELSYSKWRGSCLDFTTPSGTYVKVIPTFSLEALRMQYHQRPIFLHDIRRAVKESATRTYPKREYNFITRPCYEVARTTLSDILAKIEACEDALFPLSVDLETRAGHIACVGLAWTTLDAICIPLMCVERADGYWELDEEHELVWLLYQIMHHPKTLVVGQNFSYDIQYTSRYLLCYVRNIFDTMIAQHTLFPTMEKSLAFMSSIYTERPSYWKDDGKDWNPKIPEDQLWAYNCRDCVETLEIFQVLKRLIVASDQQEQVDFQFQMFFLVARLTEEGVLVDLRKRARISRYYNRLREKFEAWLHDVVGQPLNPASPKQMADFFYEQLRLPVQRNRTTNTPTCDDHALEKIAGKEPIIRPIIKAILRMRTCRTLLANAIDKPLDTDSKLRCAYNLAGTKTFRLASSTSAFGYGHNMQNITGQIKSYLIPPEGCTAFDMDLDSADLRIVVAESGEQRMLEWLDAGLKPYVMVAREFHSDSTIDKSHPQYRIFKALCHGTHYLGRADGIAANIGLDPADVADIQKWYLDRFPRIRQWQNRFKAELISRKMVRNIFGNRLVIFDRIEGNVFNEAIAWIPQSTIGLLINRIWRNVARNHPTIQIRMQTHDSLAGYFPTISYEEHMQQLHMASKVVLPYPTPIIIPIGLKTSPVSYGDCK